MRRKRSNYSKIVLIAILMLVLIATTACNTVAAINTMNNTSSGTVTKEAILKGYQYLENNYDSNLNLLCETPDDSPALQHTYWLANDNLLASYALKSYDAGLSAKLMVSIEEKGYSHDHYIELLFHKSNLDPTRAVAAQTLDENDNYVLKNERPTDTVMQSYALYLDRLCYKALWYFYAGNVQEANDLFNRAKNMWDGKGFKDRAFQSNPENGYNTYKLALFYFTAKTLGKLDTVTFQDKILSIIASVQDANGGFHTFYSIDNKGKTQIKGSTNTETTSLVLIALVE
jgi:hypothetical protein